MYVQGLRKQRKKLLLCACCIIFAIITVRKGVMRDIRCKMIEEWDLNYITLFLFAVETAEQHKPPPTQSSFSIPITAEARGGTDM